MLLIKDKHVRMAQHIIYDRYGIVYQEHKKDMLKAKLTKLMKHHKIDSADDLLSLIEEEDNSGGFYKHFQDVITTHKTNFFRENKHFEYLHQNFKHWIKEYPHIFDGGEIRAWSAASSTGEEVYSLAMCLKDAVPAHFNVKVLGTDVSVGVVKKAMEGVYPEAIENDVKKLFLNKYFNKQHSLYEVNDELKSMITFRQFNLMDPFTFKNKFALIFCRNVMIYFDTATQRNLLEKFYQVLPVGGLLFLGLSENMIHKDLRYKFVQPSVYMKF